MYITLINTPDNCSNGDLSQVGNKEVLQICISGLWRRLCSKFWSIEQTNVACRQLRKSGSM